MEYPKISYNIWAELYKQIEKESILDLLSRVRNETFYLKTCNNNLSFELSLLREENTRLKYENEFLLKQINIKINE